MIKETSYMDLNGFTLRQLSLIDGEPQGLGVFGDEQIREGNTEQRIPCGEDSHQYVQHEIKVDGTP